MDSSVTTSDSSQMPTVEKRLAFLERQNRLMRKLLVGLGMLVLLPYLVGTADQQREVEAEVMRIQRIELVMGREVVATLKGMTTERGKALGIFGGGGKALAAFVDTKHGSDFYLYKKDGKKVGAFFTRSDGAGGELQIFNNDGIRVAELIAERDGGRLRILSPNRKVRFSVP